MTDLMSERDRVTTFYGLRLTEEEQDIIAADPKHGMRRVLGTILENGYKARQAQASCDWTETHRQWQERCDTVLAAARAHTLAAVFCPDELLTRFDLAA